MTLENSPNPVSRRLKKLVDLAGSQRKFAKVIDRSVGSINGWINVSAPMESRVEEIARIVGVSPAWLLHGEGNEREELDKFRAHLAAHPPAANADDESGRIREEAPPMANTTGELIARRIPVVSLAEAGPAIMTNWHDVDNFDEVEVYAVKDPKAIAVRITGESMSPDYKPGTVAILYPGTPPRSENLVVARLKDGQVVFKRLHIVGNKYHLLSVNPAYSPIVVDASEVERMLTVGKTERNEL